MAPITINIKHSFPPLAPACLEECSSVLRLVRLMVMQRRPRADGTRDQFLGCSASKSFVLVENESIGAQQGLVG